MDNLRLRPWLVIQSPKVKSPIQGRGFIDHAVGQMDLQRISELIATATNAELATARPENGVISSSGRQYRFQQAGSSSSCRRLSNTHGYDRRR